jgi:alpha-beta hydrolase superfamily lysophospholipase
MHLLKGQMKTESFTFLAEDGTEVFVRRWTPTNVKAVCQIAHGMAEHGQRYQHFACALANAGYAVYANDHRGHGKTAGRIENLGYFADENGWNLVVEDMRQLTGIINANHGDLPVFLLGHSMGSLLAVDYISKFGDGITGALLSAPPGDPGLRGIMAIYLAKLERYIKGKKAASPMFDQLIFGNFNKAFKPNRTAFDWLSRDGTEVDKYVADPFCGTIFTCGFFVDFLVGVKKSHSNKVIDAIPKDLAIHITAGEKDPVGYNAKGVIKLKNVLEKAKIEDISFILYHDARHEILNEINKEEVYRDILAWMDERT